MTDQMQDISRRNFLKVMGAAGAVVGLGGIVAACSAATSSAAPTSAATAAGSAAPSGAAASASAAAATGEFNWMTWGDHSYPAQLDAIAKAAGIKTNQTLFSDNIEAYTKLKEVGGQLDMVSGDALWVPHYFENGLTEAFDLAQLAVSKQLYSIAQSFPIWTKPEGYLGYPIGWSPVQIYYDPAKVSPAPDSWEVLLDPKYKKRVVVEEQAVETMAYMGKLTGAKNSYSMTDDEVAKAKEALIRLKPNVLKLANQATDTIAALKSGEAWLATGNLGTDARVKDQGGPELKVFTPKEGTIGWMDSEMIVKGGANQKLLMPFLELAEQAEYMAANFMLNGRPLFNEAAYKILINQGQQERADRFLYNKPETVETMSLKGPGTSTQAAVDAFNDVFGG
jgi:spermidine/putrescine transport system substrate-binding protein